MAIPEAQLETWSNQGATASAQLAHQSVRYALETSTESRVRNRNIEIFLQGSYRNHTNIYADSDVDIVVLLKETFTHDTTYLQPLEQIMTKAAFGPMVYSWNDFKRDVLSSLRTYYGYDAVREGNKAINLVAAPGRLSADIIPAVQHRLYRSPGRSILSSLMIPPGGQPWFIEGVSFWDRNGRQIINYPKKHIDNGQDKNSDARTKGQYKPTVRMFKNAQNKVVADRLMQDSVAPSYFVECLLYNVPDDLFTANRRQTMYGIVEWLSNASKNSFSCQNRVTSLFGQTPEQWSMPYADALINAYIKLRNDWR